MIGFLYQIILSLLISIVFLAMLAVAVFGDFLPRPITEFILSYIGIGY
ncbi:MAG: hypothetical protein LBL13_03095 [Bacteroidales bacterium]|nr:hypothetical protein [Bacteroidales bacterium]